MQFDDGRDQALSRTLARRNRQLQILAQAAQRIGSILEVSVVVRALISSAVDLVDARSGCAGQLVGGKLTVCDYYRNGVFVPGEEVYKGQGIPQHVLTTGSPYISNDAASDSLLCPKIRENYAVHNLIAVPIPGADGLARGVLELHNKNNAEDFDDQDIEMLRSLIATASLALRHAEHLSQRKAAEQQLRVKESRYRQVVDNVHDVIFHTNVEGELLFLNPAWSAITGFSVEESLGRPFWDFLHPEETENSRGLFRKSMQNRWQHCEREVRFHRRDGAVGWLELHSWLTLDDEDQVVGSAGILRDVSHDRQMRSRLMQAATVYENTMEGVVITDSSASIIAVNNAFERITGYSEAEVLGKNPNILNSGRHDQTFYQAMWSCLVAEGQWQGEIWNRRKNGEVYPEWLNVTALRDDQGNVTNYVAVFSDISAIKESQQQLDFLIHHDLLTGLPNRLLFTAHLKHALQRSRRTGSPVGVMTLDLDRFKTVNDSMGHMMGDRLLQEMALRLKECVHEEDTVARLGGDEFSILLETIPDAPSAAMVAQKILDQLDEPFALETAEAFVTASIGISIYPGHGEDVTTLLKNADTAMNRAKDQGKNTYQFYTSDLTQSAMQRFALENDLRRAIQRDEFVLHYQPFIQAEDGQIVGAEALIRWNRPDCGLVSPGDFIPLAEETGLIEAIGAWALNEACSQLKRWDSAGLRQIRVAVNISRKQIERGDLFTLVERTLEQTQLEAARLELEITENFFVRQPERAIIALEKVKQLGISLAIDDFGTGYSSMHYLKRLPIDVLKIDRSFVSGIPGDDNDTAIARAIIVLGHSLRLKIIAEGVETSEQLAFLRESGCDEAQGYYIGRPRPAERLADLIGPIEGSVDSAQASDLV